MAETNKLPFPLITKTGEGSYLRQQFPKLYGTLAGLLGTDPSEIQGSLLDANTAKVKEGAAMGYLPGLLAEVAPVGKLGAGAAALGGMFIGKGAKTWDALAASKALAMEKAGVDARKVWGETGTWKGPDGMWRQEIPDNMAKGRDYQLTPAKAYERARVNAMIEDSQAMRDRANSMTPYAEKTKNQLTNAYSETGGQIVDAALSGNKALATQLSNSRGGLDALLSEMANAKHGPASSYLKHGELGKAYPDVYAMHTRIDPSELSGSLGQYMRSTPLQGEQVVLANKPVFKDAQSTMLHELQHAIQQREGFARGGSPDGMRDEAMNMLRRDVASGEIDSTERAMSMLPMYQQNAYNRLAGEAEARATQARIPLDAAQRRALFPEDSYDVPINQLIVRGGLLGQ